MMQKLMIIEMSLGAAPNNPTESWGYSESILHVVIVSTCALHVQEQQAKSCPGVTLVSPSPPVGGHLAEVKPLLD